MTVIFQELLVCLLKASEKAACIARACRSFLGIADLLLESDILILIACKLMHQPELLIYYRQSGMRKLCSNC